MFIFIKNNILEFLSEKCQLNFIDKILKYILYMLLMIIKAIELGLVLNGKFHKFYYLHIIFNNKIKNNL
jgi:hypothetical protein